MFNIIASPRSAFLFSRESDAINNISDNIRRRVGVCSTASTINMRKNMIYTNTESIPGREIVEILGVVTGNVVQTKHVGKDIMAGLKTLVGGEIESYTEMFTEARQKAIGRMVKAALDLDADAVVSLRFTTSSIMRNASEILAFGTAVRLK